MFRQFDFESFTMCFCETLPQWIALLYVYIFIQTKKNSTYQFQYKYIVQNIKKLTLQEMSTSFYNYKTKGDQYVWIKLKSKDKSTWPKQVFAVCFSFSRSFPVNNFCSKTQTENLIWDRQLWRGQQWLRMTQADWSLTNHSWVWKSFLF